MASLVVLLRQDRAGNGVDEVVGPTSRDERLVEPILDVPPVRFEVEGNAKSFEIFVDPFRILSCDAQDGIVSERGGGGLPRGGGWRWVVLRAGLPALTYVFTPPFAENP